MQSTARARFAHCSGWLVLASLTLGCSSSNPAHASKTSASAATGAGRGAAGGGAAGSSATATGAPEASPTPPQMSSGCGASTLMPGDSTNMMMTKDGMTRSYLLHVPASYDGSTAVPFLLDIHGWTSNAMQQQGLSGWKAKSDEEGFIAAWPDGIGNSWNGGSLCCGTAQSSGIDDEGFMRQLVEKIEGQACIDTTRVYATGLSNGGAMSHLLACKAADVFAATAPVSMGNGSIPCSPTRPISVIMFRDMSDPLVSYTGGLFPSAMADFDQWKMLAGCDGTAQMTQNGHCQLYTGCSAGTEVELCTTTSAGHVLYPNSDGVKVPDVAWETFSRQALP